MAGDIMGLQMGLGFAVFYDVQAAGQTPVLGQFLNMLAMLMFLILRTVRIARSRAAMAGDLHAVQSVQVLRQQSAEVVSSAVCPGTIQLPPAGQPILLMADCATSGGYPRIAHVASVDLPQAAQLRPGDSFRLGEISLAEAHNLYCRREAALRCLQTNLKLKLAT